MWLWIVTALFLLILIRMVCPTWKPKINKENSITEYSRVEINDDHLQVLIRGENKNNPVLLFVHGGPCCSEIPYERKYMRELEKDYTVVLYDQCGSGKSFDLGKDYSWVTAQQNHVEDLISLTEYLEKYLEVDQVILLGHSYGTYIAMQVAAQRPDQYRAYVGIGQMSDTVLSESFTLEKCIAEAKNRGDEKAAASLTALRESVSAGERIVPREYVRKYGLGARKIDDNRDYWTAFLFGTEYNLLDRARMYIASGRYQDALITEALNHPLSEIVTGIQIPVYFLMGRYDGMTSPEAAEVYLQIISGEAHKEMVMFDESAHYPQFEEADEFRQWLLKTLP